MPWYWSDDAASLLRVSDKAEASHLEQLTTTPFALRCDVKTIKEAAELFVEDDDPPLAA